MAIGGELGYLVAGWLAQGTMLFFMEAMAAAAPGWPVLDDLTHCLVRGEAPTTAFMPRLGTPSVAGRPSSFARRRLRRILAGRQRGVARVAEEAPFKLGDTVLLLSELRLQHVDLGREREERGDNCVAPLFEGRLCIGALHVRGIRAVGAMTCLPPQDICSGGNGDQLNAYHFSKSAIPPLWGTQVRPVGSPLAEGWLEPAERGTQEGQTRRLLSPMTKAATVAAASSERAGITWE